MRIEPDHQPRSLRPIILAKPGGTGLFSAHSALLDCANFTKTATVITTSVRPARFPIFRLIKFRAELQAITPHKEAAQRLCQEAEPIGKCQITNKGFKQPGVKTAKLYVWNRIRILKISEKPSKATSGGAK